MLIMGLLGHGGGWLICLEGLAEVLREKDTDELGFEGWVGVYLIKKGDMEDFWTQRQKKRMSIWGDSSDTWDKGEKGMDAESPDHRNPDSSRYYIPLNRNWALL